MGAVCVIILVTARIVENSRGNISHIAVEDRQVKCIGVSEVGLEIKRSVLKLRAIVVEDGAKLVIGMNVTTILVCMAVGQTGRHFGCHRAAINAEQRKKAVRVTCYCQRERIRYALLNMRSTAKDGPCCSVGKNNNW